MKILHITFCGVSKINGVVNAVNNLSSEQSKLGHDVIVGSVQESPLIRDLQWRNISNYHNFTALIREFKPDIVIFNALYLIKYLSYSRFLNKSRIPYLITFHGGASRDNYKKHKIKKYVANLLLFNRFIKGAQAVVYLNKGEYNNSIFNRINNKFVFIPNGIKVNCTSEKKVETSSKLKILFLSRMDVHGKGLDVLYDSLCLLYEKGLLNDISFDFYGYNYSDYDKKLERFGEAAVYKGIVNGDEKNRVLSEADLMILPSRSEGMPLTVLEGLAYGLPSIVTPQTNMGDLLEVNGCGWVTSLNPKSLSKTIVEATREYKQDREGYIERCRKLAESFSWDKIAFDSIKIYQEFISAQPRTIV